MSASCTAQARPTTCGHPKACPVPRAGRCRPALLAGIGFATLLLMPAVGRTAAAGYSYHPDPAAEFAAALDHDGNGVEDLLDAWRAGDAAWDDLRGAAVAAPARAAKAGPVRDEAPALAGAGDGPWARGLVRLLWFDAPAGAVQSAADRATDALDVLHELPGFRVHVLACDAVGLEALLAEAAAAKAGRGRLMLDRDGVPALDAARILVGGDRVRAPGWTLGRDWSSSIAILDSGCDTAHGDLGDAFDDDTDGPPPAVGDAADWYPAALNWPLFTGYRVVGWADVTDDFPDAAGPWDYHYHGTALASAAAGSGTVDAAYSGLAPTTRLTIVKFYDFDVTWHAWAGDFLAACAWVLDNRESCRIRTVLAAVNWDEESGLTAAIDALLDAGIAVVAAAGNDGDTPAGLRWPARLAGVLAVGGVNDESALAAFSSRGAADPGDGPVKPDLVAPAGGLLPERGRITAADNEPNDSYTGRMGTSLAAAQAAGALALLDEALADRGVILPRDREGALTRQALLAATALPVSSAESADGAGTESLPRWTGPDRFQGGGLLRIDAAVAALCRPLGPGSDQLDTLSADFARPVAARRLLTEAGLRYLVEAVPSPGLDVILEVVDVRGRISGRDDASLLLDAGGAGVSEFAHVTPADGHWLALAVKRRSGSGTVVLRLREADSFAGQGWDHRLPGRMTGAPNHGRLGAAGDDALVIPSLVAVDDGARAVTVLRPDGTPFPDWPVFVFPPVSAEGGLTEPLVWDLDGVPGDEIVCASDHGAMYFFAGDGSYVVRAYAFNLPLTAPVGIDGPAGRRVASVDDLGRARTWSAGGLPAAERVLGHLQPLAPAAGVLLPGQDESLVIVFRDGHVRVLDADLADRPGWPRDLGAAVDAPPVLVDLDEDGGREIVIAVRDPMSGLVTLRVLDGTGEAGPGDFVAASSPEGGPWVALAAPVVTGRYGTGELGVSVTGIASNGAAGASHAWSLARAVLLADGGAWAENLPGFTAAATTGEGQLTLAGKLLPAPVAWNILGGTGTEPAVFYSIAWSEIISGVTSIPGAATGWLVPDEQGRVLTAWRPRLANAPGATSPGAVGCLVLPRGDGTHLRLDVVNDMAAAVLVPSGGDERPLWSSQRGDGRNSASYPLNIPVAAVDPLADRRGLDVFPNPGTGRFRFRAPVLGEQAEAVVDIYDLRGRRVRTLHGVLAELAWDGRDRNGRSAAAGTYLAAVRSGGRSITSRFQLAR
jgi:hypothetical protein